MVKSVSKKPENSKTVNQLALMGKIPKQGASPSYILTVGDKPTTIYFLEEDSRDMTLDEKQYFEENSKAYCENYIKIVQDILDELRKRKSNTIK
ncbi:MAG: hypothetical protein ACRC9L_04505 [Brevinema sp.]